MQISDHLLKASLKEKFKGVIWKIELDEFSSTIAIESRDIATHNAYFSAYDYVSGQCHFKEKLMENSWWLGLDRAHQGHVYLHGFTYEGSPEHKGIIALNSLTGEIKWEQFNTTLYDISDDGLVSFSALIQPRKFNLIAPESGQLLRYNYDKYEPLERKLKFPEPYSGELPGFIPDNIAGPVYYLSYQNKHCWSFHTIEAQLFDQHLVISEQEEILLSVILTKNIQKLIPEAFFVHQNHLICIRDKDEVIAYLL